MVALKLGLKLGAGKRAEVKKTWWQSRLENSIEMWWKHLGLVEQIRKGNKLSTKARSDLERKYQLVERGTTSVIIFFKIQAGSTKIRWYVEKKVARRQKNLFWENQ